jgi:hypothetical protein
MYETAAPAAWLIDLVHSSKSGSRPRATADIHALRRALHILDKKCCNISVLQEDDTVWIDRS